MKIHPVIEARFDVALAEKVVPQRLNFHYIKWLRYYLDPCHNYHLDKSAKQSFSDFIKKYVKKDKMIKNKQQTRVEVMRLSIDERAESPWLSSDVRPLY